MSYNSVEIDTTDYVKSLGVVSGRLKDDGTVNESQSGWYTTSYIPVEIGNKYYLQTPNMSGTYTVYRCTYDSNRQLLESINFGASAPERSYDITGRESYVRFSISSATYKSGFKFRKSKNRVDIIESKVDTIIKDNFIDGQTSKGELDYIALFGTSYGRVLSDGSLAPESQYRSTQFIPVKQGVSYRLNRLDFVNFSVSVCEYDSNKSSISYVDQQTAYEGYYFYTPSNGALYVKFSYSTSSYEAGVELRSFHNWGDVVSNNIKSLNDVIWIADYISLSGVTYEVLTESGETSASQMYVTTDYIPITAGVTYALKRIGHTDSYTVKRCFYDTNKQLIYYVEYSAESPIKEFTCPYNVAYVRFSFSKGTYNSGVTFGLLDNRIDTLEIYDEMKKDWITADEELLEITDYIKEYGWETGKLADGVVDTTNFGFVTIADYIPLGYGELLSLYNNGGRTVWIDLYTEDKTFIKEVYKTITDVDIYYTHYETDAHYVKISVSSSILKNYRFSVRKTCNETVLAKNNVNQAKSVFCIMGYNTGGWYIGTGANVPEELTEQAWETQESIIARYNPDVLMLCEYWKYFSPGVPSERLLRKYYKNVKEHYAYSTYWGKCNATNRKVESTIYGTMSGGAGNKYLLNYIYFNGKKVALINTHLSSAAGDAGIEDRILQCRDLLSICENEEYFIMYGDWNIEKGTEHYNETLKLFKDAGYKFAVDGELETYREYPSSRSVSIDDIITSPNITLKSILVDEQKRSNPIFTKYDHSPVIAYFEIF